MDVKGSAWTAGYILLDPLGSRGNYSYRNLPRFPSQKKSWVWGTTSPAVSNLSSYIYTSTLTKIFCGMFDQTIRSISVPILFLSFFWFQLSSKTARPSFARAAACPRNAARAVARSPASVGAWLGAPKGRCRRWREKLYWVVVHSWYHY